MGKDKIHLIRIIKKSGRFTKDVYNPAVREAFHSWPGQILSSAGKWDNGHLILSHDISENHNPKRLQALVLFDELTDWEARCIKAEKQNGRMPGCRSETIGLNRETKQWPIEFFTLSLNENGEFDVFLNYDAHASWIGEPIRENHQIGTLKKGIPAEICINGKTDFSLTGRRQRTYAEFSFLMEYYGTADTVECAPAVSTQTAVYLPAQPWKKIDLRKRFY